jgi:hypothetical protein
MAQLVKYRHWLAHGRYWTQKSGIRPTPEQAWDTGTIVFAVLPGLEDALMERLKLMTHPAHTRVELGPMARLWGSCGRDGVVRLDQCFMQLPAHLGEYLAAHEAIHLVHRDHSARFWRLLRTLLPDARARHEELVGHGRGL